MKRTFPLTSAYFYLSDQCNLKCGHCWIVPRSYGARDVREEPQLDLRCLKKFVLDAKVLGLKNAKLTGGEPFLRKDILELVRFLKDESIDVSIETNGTLLDEQIVEVLGKCSLELLSVSLDSAVDEEHDSFRGLRGCFDRIIQILPKLVRNGINTQVIMSLHKGNAGQIERLVELVAGFGVKSIKINPIMPSGRGKSLFEMGRNLAVKELIALDRWIEEDLIPRYGVDLQFDLPIALKSLKTIRSGSLPQCRILNIIGVLANGDISLCGVGQTESDIVMGNLNRDHIGEIWEKHPLLLGLRKRLPGSLKGICGKCIFQFICLGACRACAYVVSRELYAPFHMCEEAERSHLFPESRRMS